MIRTTNIRDSYYKQYVKTESVPVSRIIYTKIVIGFISFVMRKVFEGFDVRLAGGKSLGTIGIRGRRLNPKIDEDGNITGLSTDWKLTYELWNSDPEAKANNNRIYYMNEHSSSIRYKISWWSEGMVIANKYLYSLVFTYGPKGNRRKLAKKIKEEDKEYLVLVKPKKMHNGD